MKILSSLFFSFLILSLVSCSKDDEPEPENNGNNNPNMATVPGEWEVDQFTMSGTIYDENATITFDGVANDLTGNDITFHEDNTTSGNNAPFDMTVDSEVDGMPVSYTQTMSSVMTHGGDWSQTGDSLYLQESGSADIEAFFIESLNASTLVLLGDENSVTTDSSFPPGSEFDVTITLTR